MNLDIKLSESKQSFTLSFGEIHKVSIESDIPPYTGEYTVTPKVNSQTLETAKKLMINDVTIKAIPYYDVGNTSGGSTVYIGNEV